MKRKRNRRALSVFILISLFYAFFGFDLGKEVKVKREVEEKSPIFQTMSHVAPTGERISQPKGTLQNLVPLILVCAAIKKGQIDENHLILLRRGDNFYWKKPLEIIKDRDKEGLEILSGIMGKAFLVKLLKEEGIEISTELSPETIILGRDYTIPEEKILQLYEKYVKDNYRDLLSALKGEDTGNGALHGIYRTERSEWVMPNLKGYSMREAIRVLNRYTGKIRVVGFGQVTDQYPNPYAVLKGETECVLKGEFN